MECIFAFIQLLRPHANSRVKPNQHAHLKFSKLKGKHTQKLDFISIQTELFNKLRFGITA